MNLLMWHGVINASTDSLLIITKLCHSKIRPGSLVGHASSAQCQVLKQSLLDALAVFLLMENLIHALTVKLEWC